MRRGAETVETVRTSDRNIRRGTLLHRSTHTGSVMGDNTKVSIFEAGMPGLHLVINPSRKPAPAARVGQPFAQRGIRLSDKELKSLLAGRSLGIASINRLLGTAVPQLSSDNRLKLSGLLADALLDKALQGQLSRERPLLQEQEEQREQRLRALFAAPVPANAKRGSLPQLLREVPVGASLTVHF